MIDTLIDLSALNSGVGRDVVKDKMMAGSMQEIIFEDKMFIVPLPMRIQKKTLNAMAKLKSGAQVDIDTGMHYHEVNIDGYPIHGEEVEQPEGVFMVREGIAVGDPVCTMLKLYNDKYATNLELAQAITKVKTEMRETIVDGIKAEASTLLTSTDEQYMPAGSNAQSDLILQQDKQTQVSEQMRLNAT